jgi:hypothetical protein
VHQHGAARPREVEAVARPPQRQRNDEQIEAPRFTHLAGRLAREEGSVAVTDAGDERHGASPAELVEQHTPRRTEVVGITVDDHQLSLGENPGQQDRRAGEQTAAHDAHAPGRW